MTKRVFLIVFSILVIWSLWSLSYSPIVWLDEAMISSYTHSFINGNGISVELDDYAPVPIYGPVFFFIQGAFVKLLGFNPFVCRLVNLLFAFLSVFVLGKVLQALRINRERIYLLLLLFAADVTFISNSHSGRMEFVAIFFALMAYWCFLSPFSQNKWSPIVASLMLVLAFMTTPRSAVICAPIVVLYLRKLVVDKSWLSLSFFILIPFTLYSLWIFYAFGSYTEMFNFYLKPNEASQNVSFTQRFVHPSLNITLWHYPIVFTALFFIIHSVIHRYWKKLLLYIAPIVLFYLIVYDMGGYDIFIIPFYIVIIAVGCDYVCNNSISKGQKLFSLCLVLLCLFINVSVFLVKDYSILCSKESRDHAAMSDWFCANIPQGKVVAGSYAFYYAAINNDCTFKRLERDNIEPERVFKELEKYNPEYIIISRSQMTEEAISCFEMFDTSLIATYQPKACKNKLVDLLSHIIVFNSSYECELYKVNY